MMIDTKSIVSIAEANQDFSKVVKLVEETGKAVITKNNVPKYLVIDFNEIEKQEFARDETVMEISKRLMEQNKVAYEVLSK